MLDLIPAPYRMAFVATCAILCVLVGATTAWTVQGYRLDAAHAKYDLFVGQVQTMAKMAEDETEQKVATNKKRKEQSDAENKRTLDSLHADIKRLHDARSGSSFVPAAPASAIHTDLACFDRGELEQSIRAFDLEVSGIVNKGSEATVNLNSAKLWAQGAGR